MNRNTLRLGADDIEWLDQAGLGLQDLARCCRVSPDWIATRVQAGVLQPQQGQRRTEWRFATTTLVRVRRIAQLEQTYDADPQLAALAVDLMEEVARLRRQLEAL